MKIIKNIIICFFLGLFSICIAYVYRPYLVSTESEMLHSHAKYDYEQRLYLLRLKINYSSQVYEQLDIRYAISGECNNVCYPYIDQFYTIGLKHYAAPEIGNDIMHFLLDQQDVIHYENIHNASLIKIETLLLSIKLDPVFLKYFLCNYKTTNHEFIEILTNKYHLNNLTCEQKNE